jgi:hypothetical protein
MLHNLHTQVSDHYAAYHNDSSYVLPRHNYLFKQRSLEDRLKQSYEEDSYLPSRQEDVTYIANTHDTLSLTDFSISTPDSDSDGTTSSKSSASSTVYIQPVHQFPKW